MAIPIQNIYYLLCYAWNKLDESELVQVEANDKFELIDLFAKVLVTGTTHLFKRGLDRDYIEIEEKIPGIKGKFNLSHTLKRNLHLQGQTICTFDDFSYNILQNQILKSTISRLLKTEDLDRELKNELLVLYRKFSGVSEVVLDSKIFSKVKLHRNNGHYGLLIEVSRIIYESLLPNEEKGTYVFRDFLRNERKMAYLFEKFVYNFYKREFPQYSIFREDIRWQVSAEPATVKLLPKMQTDISVLTKNRIPTNQKLIIDTKFYKDALRSNYDAFKFHEGNMYQLFAYLKNIESKDPVSKKSNGLLLYPSSGYSLKHQITFGEHTLFFRTVDLNQHWEGIKEELKGVLRESLQTK